MLRSTLRARCELSVCGWRRAGRPARGAGASPVTPACGAEHGWGWPATGPAPLISQRALTSTIPITGPQPGYESSDARSRASPSRRGVVEREAVAATPLARSSAYSKYAADLSYEDTFEMRRVDGNARARLHRIVPARNLETAGARRDRHTWRMRRCKPHRLRPPSSVRVSRRRTARTNRSTASSATSISRCSGFGIAPTRR
jgi:hypothetical protein